MATFIMLSTLGPEGAATLKERPERLREVNEEVGALGARVLGQWALLGPYDFCTVLEVKDETAMAKIALALGARGTLKTLTMPAIPSDELLSALRD